MSLLGRFIETILNSPRSQEEAEHCTEYLVAISDDLLAEVKGKFHWVDCHDIDDIWKTGIRLLIDELRSDP
mgnify:CR=1 FL=1